MSNDLSLLYRTYDAFNARDIDAVLCTTAPDVDWANAWEGGRLVGHAALRDYWIRQWQAIDPTVMPMGYTRLPDGRLRLEVHQTVLDLTGNRLSEGIVGHVYSFRDGLISRMEIE